MDESSVNTSGDDLKSLPIRAYLDKTVVPILLLGLAETAKERSFRFRTGDVQTQQPYRISREFPVAEQSPSQEGVMYVCFDIALFFCTQPMAARSFQLQYITVCQ